MTDVNQPSDTSLLAHLEAVLFSAAKPVPIALLGELFDCATEEAEALLEQYANQLVVDKRGLRLKVSGVGAELVSAPESSEYVSKIRQREDRLSPAAMETLAVIAFKQPVTKSEIEEVRGVNCEKVLKHLVSRDLVMELGRKESIGRPVLYGTTDTFLRSVGIESVETLKREVAVDNGVAVTAERSNTIEADEDHKSPVIEGESNNTIEAHEAHEIME
ncbi:SMC-Scp complex subunit ScpB [Veillonella ratti]|uniref:SMC-Scp complex subunit ScpB n=1 Tax=Veillonella ratti TaxID=103892 RepID=UPI000F8D1090|nr:SMC-Scp complex subunit ScpB [Veillonella ratti]